MAEISLKRNFSTGIAVHAHEKSFLKCFLLFQAEHQASHGPILGAIRAHVHSAGRKQWEEDVRRFSVMTSSRDKLESIARAQVLL
jgi:hypothetical protein